MSQHRYKEHNRYAVKYGGSLVLPFEYGLLPKRCKPEGDEPTHKATRLPEGGEQVLRSGAESQL